MWLLAVFIAVPVIEIALFIKIGGWLTLWPTLAIVVGTALLGTSLVKRQGRQVLSELRRSINDVRDPSEPLAHGAMILVAGVLLLTPGFLTDVIGLLLLIPWVRKRAFLVIRRNISITTFANMPPGGGRGPRHRTEDDVIEGDYHPADTPESSRIGPSGWTQH